MSVIYEKISVIIPTWNRSSTIAASIESVLNQTYPIHEILICDDGSTDNTREILTSFTDSRIRFIGGAHSGLPAVPRNRGLRESTGDWVAFLDSDDCWLPEKLSFQMQAVGELGCKASSTNAWRVTPEMGRTIPYLQFDSNIITLHDLLRGNYIICSSVIVRREIALTCGGFPEDRELKAIEDFALWLRVAAMTDFVYCNEPLIDYLDFPSESVRANTNEARQQEAVRLNYLTWAKNVGLKSEVISSIKKSTRRSMKNNGRGFWSRIKI